MEVIKKKMNSLKEKLVQSEAAATEAENEYNEIMIKAEDVSAHFLRRHKRRTQKILGFLSLTLLLCI